MPHPTRTPAKPGGRGEPPPTAPADDLGAVLFDMDGVVTDTAEAHAAAWKRLFDEYLKKRADDRGDAFHPFDLDRDYREYVDGKPRYDGVKSFLESRGIALTYGKEDDDPDRQTICGLGNRKNRYFNEWLDDNRVRTFPGTLAFIEMVKKAGVKVGIFSSSRNAEAVLRSAGVLALFDAKVDGNDLAERHLAGKPDPASLLEAASRLGVPPGRAAIVEDAIAGVEAGARGNFGLVIGVDRGQYGDALQRAGAHLVVGDLAELKVGPDGRVTRKTLSNLPSFGDRKDEVQQRLSGKTPVAFLDYDGTLTPIVEDYTKAFLSPDMRTALAALGERCTVAVVSGRDVEVLRRLVGLDGIYYAGSHGFEIVGPKGWSESLEKGVEFLPEIDEAERQLRGRLSEIAGHAVERKRYSIAVHYRRVADEDVPRVESIVDAVLSEHRGLHKGRGKKVFRIQPNIRWDKGHAVQWLLERLDLNRSDVLPIYVGDDITDEDAFRMLAGRGLSLVVRDSDDRPTAAEYALADPADVKRFLEFLTTAAGTTSR